MTDTAELRIIFIATTYGLACGFIIGSSLLPCPPEIQKFDPLVVKKVDELGRFCCKSEAVAGHWVDCFQKDKHGVIVGKSYTLAAGEDFSPDCNYWAK